jgi:signal transduction histidine kinase
MQLDSQFVDNYVAAVQDEQSSDTRRAWVELRLAQDFIHNAQNSVRAGTLVITLTVALLYTHVSSLGLALWAVICAGIMIYRLLTINAFKRMTAYSLDGPIPDVTSFFKTHGWSWPVSAAAFASAAFLHYGKAPAINQYICFMILIGLGAVGASLMATRLRLQQYFAHALCGTTLLAIGIEAFAQGWDALSKTSGIFVLLIALLWVLILYIGKYLHALQASSYDAQFGNEQLIHSLRQQTLAATQAVQMKNNLLASAAHDLRQPVHALAFYADWLRTEPTLASSVIPKILAATDSVNTLFNSLFDFARIESGAIVIKVEDVDLAVLVEEMVVQFAPAAEAKGIALHTEPRPISVRSDALLLRRITANLLANAIRYTEHGSVRISVKQSESKIYLEIYDTGQGIAQEHLPHVFKEFYRAPTHEGTADSFGLGLAIVQRLCKVLGHAVTVTSELGSGTVCRVELLLPEASH